MLAAYHYDLQYRPGSKIGNADALSRLPIPATELDDIPVADVWMLETAPTALELRENCGIHGKRFRACASPALDHAWVAR